MATTAMPTSDSRAAKFAFAAGDSPITGYTIRRPIHRGGFGEVYYAVSDAGKEVALKLLQQYLDVELRGVSQCLNLKHPNLVSIFDVRTDGDGDRWVIMEYVRGGSLEDVLRAFPRGMPIDEVRAWLRGIVSGVSHLHQNGIVHRDLKPGNIYRENGTVKVGDVGLSKQMGSDRRGQHTESVGTVYYMAPEVANGRYGPELDVYSTGVMLYEMLTGRLPFEGETTAEILMKHLSAPPDLSPIPAAYRPALAHALAKDPAKRTPNLLVLEREFLQVEGPEAIPDDAFTEQPTRKRSRKLVEINFRNRPLVSVQFEDSRAERPKRPAKPVKPPKPVYRKPHSSHGSRFGWGWAFILVAAWLFLFTRQPTWGLMTVTGLAVAGVIGTRLFRQWQTPPAEPPCAWWNPSSWTQPVVATGRNWRTAGMSLGLVTPVSCLVALAGVLGVKLLDPNAPFGQGELATLTVAATVLGTLALQSTRIAVPKLENWSRSLSLAVGALTGAGIYGMQQYLVVDGRRLGLAWPPSAFESLGIHPLVEGGMPTLIGSCVFFALFFALRNWPEVLSSRRHQVFQAGSVIASLCAAWFVTLFVAYPTGLALLCAATITASSQLCSPRLGTTSGRA